MPQEKANDLFAWKSKLDDLEHLPGQPGVEKGSAWQKLHARINEKQGNKKIAWYWMAAASVIAIALIVWLAPGKKKQDVAITHNPATHSLPSQTPETTRMIQTPVTLPVIATQKQQANKTRSAKPKTIETPAVTFSDSSDATKSDVIVTVPASLDTLAEVIVAPLRKKLKVIHINELQTNTGRPEYAGSPSDRLSTGFLTRNASDEIVKIKISPSN